MKNSIKLSLFLLLVSGCIKQREGWDASGPISQYLIGKWILYKIVAPSGTKTDAQIGYKEVIESYNDGEKENDKIFRNDSLIATYTWSRNPWPDASTKSMTVLVYYTNGLKRFVQIKREPLKDIELETSGYLTQLGTAQDSVKYYYRFTR